MQASGTDSPARLTPVSTSDAPPGSLVFHDVVDPRVVSRCSALSLIAELGGEAQLPGAVSMAAFRAWLAAETALADDPEGTKLSFGTICTAAKV